MAEAIRRVQETTSQAQRAAIITLARQRAIKAVQQHLQSQGRRWRDMVRRDLVVMANDYLAAHPAELIAEAAETPKLRTLVARQARQLARNRSSKTHAPKPSEVLRVNPQYTIGTQKQVSILKRSEDSDHLVDGLRKAGLPE
jgi:hypothetical protein